MPFDLVELTARLERRRSRPILLRPFTAAAGMRFGYAEPEERDAETLACLMLAGPFT